MSFLDGIIHNDGNTMPQQEIDTGRSILHPNWQKAQLHAKAVSVGFQDHSQASRYCECCFQEINKVNISMTENTKELQILGFGIPLYFAFIRNCIFLLIVSICSYNLVSLYSSYRDNSAFCDEFHKSHKQHSKEKQAHLLAQNNYFIIRHFQENKEQVKQGQKQQKIQALQCETWMLFYSRIQKQIDVNQKLIRLSSFVIHMILLIYMRDKLVKLKQYFDQRITSPSDYTLVVKNIPNGIINIREWLRKVFLQQFELTEKQIPEIIIIPNLKRFQGLEQQLKQNIQKLKEVVKQKRHFEAEQLQKKIELIQLQIKKQVIINKLHYQQDNIEAKKAFVIINTESQLDRIYKQYSKKGLSGQSWKDLKIEKAPEPKQIIWQNFYISQKEKAGRTFLGWVLSFAVLIVITVIFFFISRLKSQKVEGLLQKFKQNRVQNASYQIYSGLIVGGVILFVVMFNKLLIATLFHHFTDMQRHSTSYKFQISFCLKYCLGLFFTTALMTLLVEAFFFKNYYQHQYGVIEQETIMYLVNSLFVPCFWVVNPVYLLRKFNQRKNKLKNNFTQIQANELMQMPGYDVGKRYGEVLQVMWFTFLYMTLIPIGGIFSSLGLFLYYWIDKYNLLRRSTIKINVSGELIHLTLKMLDFTLVLRSIGQIIFDYQIRSGPPITSWICLGLAIIYQLLPLDHIIRFFNKQKFDASEKTYREAQPKFTQTYYDQHVLFAYLKQDRQSHLKNLKDAKIKNKKQAH